jgi:predicted AAA+ superfamily ATPase
MDILLHAPRQTGKTSCLLELMERLNAEGEYRALYVNLVLMAFLHRVINDAGTLEREYAIGSGRMDLC